VIGKRNSAGKRRGRGRVTSLGRPSLTYRNRSAEVIDENDLSGQGKDSRKEEEIEQIPGKAGVQWTKPREDGALGHV